MLFSPVNSLRCLFLFYYNPLFLPSNFLCVFLEQAETRKLRFLVRVAHRIFAFQMLLTSKHICPLDSPLLIRGKKKALRFREGLGVIYSTLIKYVLHLQPVGLCRHQLLQIQPFHHLLIL